MQPTNPTAHTYVNGTDTEICDTVNLNSLVHFSPCYHTSATVEYGRRWRAKYGVWSVESGVYSVECKVWSVKCSVKCEV
jgi:hypothetical protein